MSYEEIDLSKLVISSVNVRKHLSNNGITTETSIKTLAEDIKKNSLINAICVRKMPSKNNSDMYEIYARQRRFLAVKSLDWDKVDNLKEEISLSENIQRVKMTAKDKCRVFHRLYELCNNNISMLSSKVNMSADTLKQYT